MPSSDPAAEMVAVPDALRESMTEVWEQIEQAELNPEDHILDFDNAIQSEHIVGEKIGTFPKEYVLTYFERGEDPVQKWHLCLSQVEIEDIADGV